MLDLPRYLLGVAEIGLLVGFATLGAAALRSRLIPAFTGAPAHLATAVIALALLLWLAELLGTVGLFRPLPYVLAVAIVGVALSTFFRGWRGGGGSSAARRLRRARPRTEERNVPPPGAARRARKAPHPDARARGREAEAGTSLTAAATSTAAVLIAAIAVVLFAADVKTKLGTGMTGFDSTWYHGPFAAGFFQSGDTWDLHFIAPQFLAWFYPANSELFHAIGMLAFDRDILSPLLNLGWFAGCLAACWCIGRPYGVAPWSLALGAIALSVPALSDQAGEARNDIVGTFFLLAAVAIAVNAGRFAVGPLVAAGLAAGLAAGTKLNFLLPAAVLVVGLALIAPAGTRRRAFAASGLAAAAGGGYWYLRNLVHSGNPLPWIDEVGPVALAAPDQALGGREGHSVLGYLLDGSVWSDWFLPGLHDGLWIVWPLLLAAGLAGLLLALLSGRASSPGSDDASAGRILRVAAAVGLAAALAWSIAPTSASGPQGMPRGFESGLRYLAPALVLGMALLPVVPALRRRTARLAEVDHTPVDRKPGELWPRRRFAFAAAGALLLVAVAIGYPVQRHYLQNRYADPSFTEPGLDAAFAWARDVSGSRIGTTSTRQYPLFGTDLSNEVEFVGEERPHGGFVAPSRCRAWRRLLEAGGYDYVIASRDRLEPNKPPYAPTAAWTEGPGAKLVLRTPPTAVFKLGNRRFGPSACRQGDPRAGGVG